MNKLSEAEKNGVYKAIFNRRDIRTFLQTPIPDETLYKLLEAAHSGPSVGFMQPWNFIIIKDDEILIHSRDFEGFVSRVTESDSNSLKDIDSPMPNLKKIAISRSSTCNVK